MTMKASALSAAIPILGRSAEDRKQMKRADPFGLVLRVGSVQQVDLPEAEQAVKDVASEPQSGPGSEPFAAGQRHWEGCDVQGDLRLVNEELVEAHRGLTSSWPVPTTCEARPTDESLIMSFEAASPLARPCGADNGPRLSVWTGSARMLVSRCLSTGFGCGQPVPSPSDPTARAMTIKEVSSAAVACSPINALARLVSGIVSVGLKALELVRDT